MKICNDSNKNQEKKLINSSFNSSKNLLTKNAAKDKMHEDIKTKLKTAIEDGINAKERKRMRNIVSADRDRNMKKSEVLYLKSLITRSNARIL